MLVTVDVTEACLAAGSPCCPFGCPVAVALLQLLKPDTKVIVQPDYCFVLSNDTGVSVTVPLDSYVSAKILTMDLWAAGSQQGGLRPGPFHFQVDIPEHFLNAKTIEHPWGAYPFGTNALSYIESCYA